MKQFEIKSTGTGTSFLVLAAKSLATAGGDAVTLATV
jgi:hypothetical protein